MKKNNNTLNILTIIFIVIDILILFLLFLLYGPITYFRNTWVTSALSTANHKYLAYIFYNQSQIDEIMKNNTLLEEESDTNPEEIQIKSDYKLSEYSSDEEKQVLTKDPGNDLYKVIQIEEKHYKGYLLVVYDPSKIKLKQAPDNSSGMLLEELVEENNALAGINAGGFNRTLEMGYEPLGTVIIDGKIVSNNISDRWSGGIVGFNNDNVLILMKGTAEEAIEKGIRDSVSFGPFLIVNGIPSKFIGNGGYGLAPRTAIGQRKDGIVLFLVVDGRNLTYSLGIDVVQLTDILIRYGAHNASNLDGGSSSSIVVNGQLLSYIVDSKGVEDRLLPNAWILEK